MLKKLLLFILKQSFYHPIKLMIGVLIVTVICLYKISFLEFQVNMDELLNNNEPQKMVHKKLLHEFQNDSNLFIVASGDNDSLKSFFLGINTLLESFPHWISSIDNNTSRDYLKKNIIKLFDMDELKAFDAIYNDPNLIQLLININNFFEAHYLQLENFTNYQKKNLNDFINKLFHFVSIQKDIILDEIEIDNSSKAVNALLFGNEKSFSDDGRNMMIMIEPNFNMNLSIKKQMHSINAIRNIINNVAVKHGVECSLVGPMVRKTDFFKNFFIESKYMIMISIISIVFIVISLFRFLPSFYFCFIPIIFSFIWILGLYGFVFNVLNLISIISVISCIVFILINCILFLSCYNEKRFQKNDQKSLINEFLLEYGMKLIKTSLFLSIFCFFMYCSEMKLISMIGLMIGLGIIISTILVLIIFSVLMGVNEKIFNQYLHDNYTFSSLNKFFNKYFLFIRQKRNVIFLFLLVVTCFLFYHSFNLFFEQKPSKIFYNHNEIVESNFIRNFGFSPNLFSYIVSDVDVARKIKEDLNHNEFVGLVESFSDYVPNDSIRHERFRYILEFKRKMKSRHLRNFFSRHDVEMYKKEMKRLEANFIELQHMAQINEDVDIYNKTKQLVGDGRHEDFIGTLTYLIGIFDDNLKKTRLTFFQDSFSKNMKSTLLTMANTEPLDILNMPHGMRNRLSNDSNDQFRINVYSNFNTWKQYDDTQLFMSQLVIDNNEVVGLLPMYDVLINKVNSFGYDEFILFLSCFIILMIFYNGNKYHAFYNILSFLIGSLWTFGGLVLLKQDLNIVNVCIVPIILIICLNNGYQLFEYVSNGNKLTDNYLVFKSNIFSIILIFMIFFPLSFSIHPGFSSIPIVVFYSLTCYLFSNSFIFGLFFINHEINEGKIF